MSIFTLIEIVCIFLILILQSRSFLITKKTIRVLETIVPSYKECEIKKIIREVPIESRFYYLDRYFERYKGFDLLREYIKNDLNIQQGRTLDYELLMTYPALSNEEKEFYTYNRQVIDLEAQKHPPIKKEEFFRIEYRKEQDTIDSLNRYLEKNKGAVADFSLLRDITQRNIDVIEDEVNLTIQSPLYLGLAGTMLGIIIGVSSLISSDTKNLLEEGGIDSLLLSVMIAMVCSLLGLIFTTANSAINLKGIKVEVERSKNKFFTFLQIELVPVLSENVTTGIIGLNRTIEKFGDSFKHDITHLEVMVNKNHESLLSQQYSIEELKKLDLSQIAKLNINVFSELRNSMDALEKLSHSLKNVDNFVANSRDLVQRTQDVANLSTKISQVIEQSIDLQKFLKSHFNELSDRGQIINNTVGKVDEVIAKSLNDLADHTQQRITVLKGIQLKEEDLLSNQLSYKRDMEEKIKSLDSFIQEFKKFAEEESTNRKNILSALNTNNALLHKIFQQDKNVQPNTLHKIKAEESIVRSQVTSSEDKLKDNNGKSDIENPSEFRKSFNWVSQFFKRKQEKRRVQEFRAGNNNAGNDDYKTDVKKI